MVMKKVLVVDDERLVTQSIAKNLHELGYEVIEAHSLEEVKELIANNVFDILITDTSFGVVTDET
jgi:DNA-binding response OmpR family regulator